MKPSNFYLLSLFILLVSQTFDISTSQGLPEFCNKNDKNTLLRIKNKLGNPSSLSSWDPNTDCSSWKDVQCGNEQGRVTSISFIEAQDINGPIPPYLDQLPYLTGLHFINVPNLSGPIPPYIGKLTHLITFTISGTKLTGQIPPFLGGFTNLIQLDLSSNKLTGPVPVFLGQLKKLSYLDLSSNELTGSVPSVLAQLTELSYLQLSSNKLSGRIPDFLSKLKNVNTIDLASNSLVGRIPEYLGHMPNLTTISLSNNLLNGPIPKSLGRSNLAMIKLDHNRLTGDASFLFDKANMNIVDIHIDYNFFKFDFSNVDLSRTLVGFNISHNMIYGSLPKRFGELRVEFVDMSYNQLCGPIPNGRRFKRVDPAIFSNNKCLCGGPLRACK
ncbi:polygalacturonase inhibitor-like [Silene latifolia]|uniref:polygalacturonase inhibitor-like n=1 Tax=Silene latifolia TaxID=37657 RepID=UPI003D78322B